ncbi:cupin domain-containing protein [Burkholderia gladioli]|uniref:cupin domain-containing protein n=1 Tax=Burkholderia gladioli TaxID=28095 RepID=UPI00163EFC97|nr:cupin domain-containing protein [Burkholderia gladioli]
MTAALVLHRADGTPFPTVFRRQACGEADPFAPYREFAWQGPDAMAVGRIDFTGALDVPSFPHIETIVVVEGVLTIDVDGAEPCVIGPREGVVIGAGTALRISAPAAVRLLFCSAGCAHPTKRGVFPLRADADFKPSGSLPPEVLLGPAPQCRSDNVFVEDGAGCCAGTWDSTPYHRIVRPHRVNEFMQLLSGGVRFAAPDGSVLSLGAGDALFVPRGASIGWESSERVAKFFVVQNLDVSNERD